MSDIPKAAAETHHRPGSRAWTDFLSRIESFIDSRCSDRRESYRELKDFADRQLARLDSGDGTRRPDLKDEVMPEISEIPDALDTPPPSRPASLDELLAAVVDDPQTWLSTPSAQLGWRKPADLIGTDEEVKVVSLLQAVDQGLF
jgi:hypothetical protein